MSSTGEAVAEPPERHGAEAGAERTPAGHRGARGGREQRRAVGVQEWPDGSKYQGESVDGLKHGKGKYTWKNGEFYKGHFYKDYKHGDGLYCWPTGHKFIGKFYLNRKEGYGRQLFPDGATFRGLYYADQRFGPGLASYPDGSQDVGLWLGNCLLRLCGPVEDHFSLRRFPEYAAYMDPNISTDTWTQPPTSALHSETRTDSKSPEDQDLLPDDDLILPPGIETLCTNGDDLPLPPRRRRELDRLFFGELWEPDTQRYQGYQRYPLSSLPVPARMHAHVHKHRLQAADVDWDVAAVLSLNRQSFGPKGPLEVSSEMLIQHASRGELHAVSQDLQTALVHVDVADSHGHTALIAATVNCRNSVIHLLLDIGADIDKLNSEGMSALAVCHVLYYPFLSLHAALIEPLNKTQGSPSTRDTNCQMPEEADTDQSSCTNLSDLTAEEAHVSDHSSSVSENSTIASEHWPHTENLKEEQSRQREGTCRETTAEDDDWTHRVSDGEIEKGEELTRTQEEEVAELDEEKATDAGKELTEGRDEEWSDDDVMEREERGKEDAPFVVRSLHVLDGHIPIGSVQWKEYPPKPAGRVRQGRRKHLTSEPSLDSACPVTGYDIHVTEELMQQAAEALSRTGIPQRSDTEETVRKMAAMKVEHRARLKTLKLLIERGADPNLSRVPMPVLFLAVMAADTEVIRSLLLHGARTDIPLPPQRKGFYPLHIAAALPGPAGPRITELLLHAAAVPDAQAADKNEIYEPDQISWNAQESESSSESVEGGGRTALHVACQRDGDFQNVSQVVALLLSHGACADVLWSGHSPLSLAIANGNDLAVEELLKGGADPNIPLGSRVGSALCALCNISYHLGGNRLKLFDSLVKAGADILMPVSVGDVTGTALDYAHYSFKQVSHSGRIHFLALNTRQKETLRVQRELLSRMADLLRQTVSQRERESSERERLALSSSDGGLPPSAAKHRFKFCFHCGRSVNVKLTACGRCHKVFFCSKACAMKASEEGHKEDCVMVPASTDLQKSPVVKPEWDPRSFTSTTKPQPVAATLKPPMVPVPSSFQLKSQRAPEDLSVAQVTWEVKAIKVNLEENYSFN